MPTKRVYAKKSFLVKATEEVNLIADVLHESSNELIFVLRSLYDFTCLDYGIVTRKEFNRCIVRELA